MIRIAQLTDTHVVEAGRRCHGLDTTAYLDAAVATLNALEPRVDYTIVTGDLVDGGGAAQYRRFAASAEALAMPWSVVPGNHDSTRAMRAVLAPQRFGEAGGRRASYVRDLGAATLVAVDANLRSASPGARLEEPDFAWLERTLVATTKPTMIAVHHPPFSSGLWYLDGFGFGGAVRFRELVDRHPHVGRVVSGHIHCVRSVRWRHAIACSAPSSAPQFVPYFHRLDVEMQEPGFAIHDHDDAAGWRTTIYRRAAAGYAPTQSI